MVFKWILPILLMKNICCEVNNGHHKQARSISALKTPRFNILSGNFEEENSPENYFPEMEYPSDILDVGRPYFFKASDNPVLEPFPREVKDSFKYITSGGKNVEEVSHIDVKKPVQSILKTVPNVQRNKAIVSDKKNVTYVTNESVKTQVNDSENNGSNTVTLHQINFTNKTVETNIEVLMRPNDNSTEMFDSSEENCHEEVSPISSNSKPDEEENSSISDEFVE